MLLGDIAETTFASKAELEALLVSAIGDCAWRASRSGWMARNARASCTTDAVVEAVVSALES